MIRPAVDVRQALQLLRRHVVGGADGHLGLGELAGADEPGNAEVHDLGLAVFGQPDVFRFDVAVYRALAVGIGQGLTNLLYDFESIVHAHGLAQVLEVLQVLPQGLAAQQFHGEEGVGAVLLYIEHGDDVGMGHFAAEPGFLQEALFGVAVAEQVGQQHFEGDVLVAILVESPVHRFGGRKLAVQVQYVQGFVAGHGHGCNGSIRVGVAELEVA